MHQPRFLLPAIALAAAGHAFAGPVRVVDVASVPILPANTAADTGQAGSQAAVQQRQMSPISMEMSAFIAADGSIQYRCSGADLRDFRDPQPIEEGQMR